MAAGEGVALVRTISPAAHIVREMMEEARVHLGVWPLSVPGAIVLSASVLAEWLPSARAALLNGVPCGVTAASKDTALRIHIRRGRNRVTGSANYPP